MEILTTEFENVVIINTPKFNDERGLFSKYYINSFFRKNNMDIILSESFYSNSKKNVIRGMHFQIPPYNQAKLITVIKGTIVDVIVDLRKNSRSYKSYITVELDSEKNNSIFIPTGFAHGFGVLSKEAITNYMVTSEHSIEHDKGIIYNSFGFNWPISKPIISKRDYSFPSIDDFESPF